MSSSAATWCMTTELPRKAQRNIISWNHIYLKKETNPFIKCSGFHKTKTNDEESPKE